MKKNSGITLIGLIITVIVMAILASITIYEGKRIISTSKVQTLETNMLTIQSKVKAYAEEIEARIWTESDKDTARNAEFSAKEIASATINTDFSSEALNQVKNSSIKSDYVAYKITGNALINMGLKEIQDETYIVIFSKNDYKLMDVIYPVGVNYNGTVYYTASSLQEILDEE